MTALIDKYSDEEFIQIVQSSSNLAEVAKKLGYKSNSGSNATRIRKRIDDLQLSTDHFSLGNKRPVKRTVDNIFIKDSTANQKTLREWYKKGAYTEYKCSICGQLPIWQNKDLTLILDHINGHNHDDRLENLRWVCPNCNQQLDTTNARNHTILKKKYYCLDCGKEISSKGKRCLECASKIRIVPLEKMPVTKEELKNLICTTSFLKIGEKFGVTDNAVRKWCDKFNLPRRKIDINKYTEEEWSKL